MRARGGQAILPVAWRRDRQDCLSSTLVSSRAVFAARNDTYVVSSTERMFPAGSVNHAIFGPGPLEIPFSFVRTGPSV